MSNPGIFQSSFPAERMRGAKLVEDFRDALTVARNKWTAFGAPTYAQAGGVILNGTTQYLTRPLGLELSGGVQTWHLEFYPTFAANDGADHYLISAPFGEAGRVSAQKTAVGGIIIWAGGAAVMNIALASWESYWRVNGRNLLSWSVTSGSNTAWLNGNQIGSSVTAWAAGACTSLFVGATTAGATPFAGRITRLYIGHHTSTLAEHQAYYNQSMFNWRNRATVDLPLGTAQYAPVATPTNVLVDGNCEAAGVGDWTASNATLTKEVVAPYEGTRWLKVLVVPAEPTTYARAIQNVLTIGKQYIVLAHAHGDGGVSPRIYHNGTTILDSGTIDTAWQALSDIFTAVATDISFGTRKVTPMGTEFVGFDSIYVYEYTGLVSQTLDRSGHGNHATLGDGYAVGYPTQGRGFMTFDGVNDYLSGIADPAGSYTVLGYKDTGTGWTFFSNNDLTEWTPIMTSGGFTGKLGHLIVVPEVLNATQLLDAAWQLRQYGSEV